MGGRYGAVALQAVGVAVLAAVVYLAFLKPDHPGPLSGIEAPGAQPAQVVQTTSHHGDHHHRKHVRAIGESRHKRSHRNSRGSNSSQQSSGQGRRHGRVTIARVNTPPPQQPNGPSGGGSNTPTGGQYVETITKILQKISHG